MITFLFRLWSKQHHDHQYLHHNGPQQQITVNIIHEICFWFQVKLSKPLCINRAQSINHYELCYAKIICLMIHESALCSSIILECFIKRWQTVQNIFILSAFSSMNWRRKYFLLYKRVCVWLSPLHSLFR